MKENKKGIGTLQGVIVVIVVIAIIAGVGAWYFMGGEEEPTNGEPEAPDSIEVGLPLCMSGQWGAEGQRMAELLSEIKKKINSDGGVYLSKYETKVPVEFRIVDIESEAARATELTAKLCTDYKVDMIVTITTPILAIPMANIAEKNKVPMLNAMPVEVFTGSAPKPENKWTWVWNTFFSTGPCLEAYLAGTDMFADQTNKKAAIILPDDMDGHVLHDPFVSTLEKGGYEVFDLGFFPPGTNDFTSYISKLKKNDIDIIWANMTPAGFAPLMRQMKEQHYSPKIMCVGRALLESSSVKAIGGGLPNGVMTEVWWSPKYPYPGNDWIKETWEELETGMPLSMPMGYLYACTMIAVDALERAGTLDKDAINEAIGNTEIEGPAGPIKFDPETHADIGVITLGQWQKTGEEWELEIVWSPKSEIPTIPQEEVIFPLPLLE